MSDLCKICTKCKKNKNYDDFYDNKKAKDGKASWCKLCTDTIREPYKKTKQREKWNKEYFQANKNGIKEKRRKRYAEDVEFRLSCNLRNRLGKMLKGNIKSGSAVKDLGCSVDFLKRYLETLFVENMSWENYGHGLGKWNIDHIVPLSSFDLVDREQFLKACHYTNLQPLWHIDNLKKSDMINI